MREIEESAYWLKLFVESRVVSAEKLAPLRQEWSERKQSDIDASPKGERFGSESVRKADRDFRHHPEASEDFLIHPSSLFLSHSLHLVHQRIPEERQEARHGSVTDCRANGRAFQGCVRFKALEDLALDVVGRTVARVSAGTLPSLLRLAPVQQRRGPPLRRRRRRAADRAPDD